MALCHLRLIRKAFWESSDNTYEEQLNLERELQFEAGNSEDFKEGIRAFLEKETRNLKVSKLFSNKFYWNFSLL